DGVIAFPQCGQQVRDRLPGTDDVLTRARDVSEGATDDQERERPLHLRAVLAKPEQTKRNEHRRPDRADDQPSQSILMRNAAANFTPRFHSQIEIRKSKMSQTILLQTP